MATYYPLLGKPYDQIICQDTALPNATAARLADVQITLNAAKSGLIWVRIFAASTTVELASGATLNFYLKVGTTSTVDTYIVSGAYAKESVTTTVSWTAGQLIAEFPIPPNMIGKNRYAEVWCATSGNESADKVDCYTYVE